MTVVRSTNRSTVLIGAHVAAWHAVRLPAQVTLLPAVFAAGGLYRATGAVRRWVVDTETAVLHREAVRRGDHEAARVHTGRRRR